MMSRCRSLATLSAFSSLFVATPDADACSPGEGWVQPTNYELVRTSSTIVLARAEAIEQREGAQCEGGRQGRHPHVRFQPVEAIKGPSPSSLVLHGHDVFVGRTGELDLLDTRPGAYLGACIAHDYRVGRLYLLFLEQHEGGWAVREEPISRVNEEVDGPQSPWVRAVREYLRIGALPNQAARGAALHRLAQSASGWKHDRAYAAALIADIKRVVAPISTEMSTTAL